MDRTACVDVPALPLQLLIRRRPDWADRPAVVLDRDKPQGLILWANDPARQRGVLPGMKYAAGLALSHELRGAEVSAAEIDSGVATLTALLRDFTPEVEPSDRHPGVFWLNASGLQPLYQTLKEWAQRVRLGLQESSFGCRVVVGFTRFGTYAVAKAGGAAAGARAVVFREAVLERQTARRVPLRRLDIDPELRNVLDQLGVRTVGAFVNLPAAGIRRRFGPEAHRLHRHAAGDLAIPLQPEPAVAPLSRHVDLESAETNIHRLLFLVKHSLDSLLDALASRHEALAALEIRLRLEPVTGRERGERIEIIRTASPTLDVRQILNLVHLRFEHCALPAGVIEVDLTVSAARASREQLQLFQEQAGSARAPYFAAANRALARIRAEFGEQAVVRACLTDGHLPEAQFAWQSLEQVKPPEPETTPEPAKARPLVRRLLARPKKVPDVVGPGIAGPHVVSGGWWRAPVHREYYYARWSWVYYDRQRRCWFLHGEVE